MTASTKTVNTLVAESLREIGVIRQNQTPTAEMVQRAIPKLNEMIIDWENDGIELGWYEVSLETDVIPIDKRDERLLRYNFAVELAGQYGAPLQESTVSLARITKDRAEKNTVSIIESDISDIPGSGRYSYNIQTE